MQAYKVTTFLAAMFLGHCLAAPLAGTEASTNSTLRPVELKADAQREGGPGFSSAFRAYLTIGTNRFAFLVPAGLGLQVLDQRRVHLFTGDYSCVLTVQFLESSSLDPREMNPDLSREIVLKRYAGAKILAQSSPNVCGRPASGFDLDWLAGGTLLRRTRVVLLGTDSGLMELSLSSSLEQFGPSQRHFNTLLLTLVASDPEGKLNVAPISNRF